MSKKKRSVSIKGDVLIHDFTLLFHIHVVQTTVPIYHCETISPLKGKENGKTIMCLTQVIWVLSKTDSGFFYYFTNV